MLCPYEEREDAHDARAACVAGADIEEKSFDCVPRRANTARGKKRGTPLRMTT
jgi:hypothetical protein